jgi:predicted ATPase
MVAAPRLHKRENVFKLQVQGEKKLELLKVAVVYGPNASGKSNLLKALDAVSDIAAREASTQAVLLPVSSFRFDQALTKQPSEFELHFIHKGMRYQFEIAATPDQIVTERLIAYPKGRESLMYHREYREGVEGYEFGSMMDSSKSLHDTWIRITPP